MKLIPQYLIDIIHKTVRPSHLEKLQIIENINKLIFQVIFIFSDWLLINQIIVFSTPFALGGNRFSKNSACSFEWITGAWVKMYRFDAFFRSVNSKYQLWTANIFPTYGGICKSEKIQQAFWREIKPSGVMEYKRMYLWG